MDQSTKNIILLFNKFIQNKIHLLLILMQKLDNNDNNKKLSIETEWDMHIKLIIIKENKIKYLLKIWVIVSLHTVPYNKPKIAILIKDLQIK